MTEHPEIIKEKKERDLKDLVISLYSLGKYLLSNWVVLAAAGLIGAIIGVLVIWRSPVTYSANLSFVLEEGKSSSGGLSAIAGQFGLDLGSMGGSSSILAGDNIIGMLKSRRFTEKVLLTPYANNYSLADKYADVYELRKGWKKNEKIGKDIFFPVQDGRNGYSRLQDSLLQVIEESIMKKGLEVERLDKKMTFFKVGASLEDELLSKYFTERLVDNVIDFYIDTKTGRQRTNVNRLQRRADSIGVLLNRKTYTSAAARSQLLDINPAYESTTAFVEVSSRDKMMLGAIYGEVIKNLELQKASLTQETPTIQIVDDIMLPLKKNKKSKMSYLILGALSSLSLVAFFLTIRRWFIS
jgi:hypothetical protein